MMDLIEISEHVLAATAILAGALAIYKFYKKKIKPIVEVADKITKIFNEIIPNHGTSLRDAVDRIEKQQLRIDQKIKSVNLDHPSGIFETDEHGNIVYANRTYKKIVGKDIDEIQNMNWIGSICQPDRARVVKEWESAVKLKREFYSIYKVCKGINREVEVKCIAHPIIHPITFNLLGFNGILSELNPDPVLK